MKPRADKKTGAFVLALVEVWMYIYVTPLLLRVENHVCKVNKGNRVERKLEALSEASSS
jgi:hypothetical protein